MLSRVIVIVAIVIFVAVLGCALIPSSDSKNAIDGPVEVAGPRVKLVGMPLRGVSMTVRYADDMTPYFRCIDDIAKVGADTVEFVVDVRQENGNSTDIWIDQRYTPSKPQLLELFAYAKKKNLRIVMMPVVLPQSPHGENDWRGAFKPDSWLKWFDSYGVMLKHFAQICQEGKADVLVVGSELVSSEVQTAEWGKVIKTARREFPSGMLTYSANWDHYANIAFWDQLDFIGMNSYWVLGSEKSKVPVEEVIANWRSIQKELVNFSNLKGKPIVFTEVGWCSISNAAYQPWDYTKTDLQPDWGLQKRLYEGFFKSWYGNGNLGGFMIWEWLPVGDNISPEDKTYIPKGKPAYDVLKEWLAKGPWEVK